MPARLRQVLYWAICGIAALIIIIPAEIDSINFWWPNGHLVVPSIIGMATIPIVRFAAIAILVWGGIAYRRRGGFEQPYWKKKRTRLNIFIRWSVAAVLSGPLLVYAAYRLYLQANESSSAFVTVVAALAIWAGLYLWQRHKMGH